MSTEDYQRAQEENLRSPKNRFLGIFCHANQVDDHWGHNWSFGCGVVAFSIVFAIMTIYDISSLSYFLHRITQQFRWFILWSIIRMIADLFAIVAMGFANVSVCQTNFRRATIGYYLLIVCLILNTAFIIYCITCFFDYNFWKVTTFNIILWLLNEFVLFIFCWILFCNMVDIGRKKRAQTASNPF